MNIRLFIFLILSALSTIKVYSQEGFEIIKSDNSELTLILNRMEPFSQLRTEYNLIKIYQVANESGSAGNANSEVTHKLYVAISEFDEEPRHNLFVIGSFYNPKFQKWIENDYGDVFTVEYGSYDNRKTLKLRIDLFELVIMK